jgi:hypothetical protein
MKTEREKKEDKKRIITKWICTECGDPCFLSIIDDCEVKPGLCPYHRSLDANWMNPETMYLSIQGEGNEPIRNK